MKKLLSVTVVASLLTILLPSGFSQDVDAATYQFDPTFNGVGYVTHNNAAGGDSGDFARAIAMQPDGKYVTAGESRGTSIDMAVWRYNTDGTLDTTFNGVGYAVHSNAAGGTFTDTARSVQVQNDGKIVIVGNSADADFTGQMVIWRYNANGTLDTTFGGTGFVVYSSAQYEPNQANSLVILSDGKYLITGYSDYDMIIWRYNSNGTLDTTFGGTGFVKYTSPTPFDPVEGSGIVVQEDGKYVVTGWRGNGMMIWRYNTNGSLDTSFNSTGYVVFGGSYKAKAVGIDSNNKIVVAGETTDASHDMMVWRYNSNGTIDTTFNGVGYNSFNGPGNSWDAAWSIYIQGDDKYVLAGYTTGATTQEDMAIWRYNNNGTLDTTFNGTGYITHNNPAGGNPNDSYEFGYGIIHDNGRFVVTGSGTDASFGTDDMIIWRYESSYQIGVPVGVQLRNGLIDVTTLGTTGSSGTNLMLDLYLDDVLLATIDTNLWEDLDWGGVFGEVDFDNYRSFIDNLAEMDGVNSYALYVPYREGDNRVGLCLDPGEDMVFMPDASLQDAYDGCVDFGSRSEDDEDTSIVEVEGEDFWMVLGLTQDMGGYSYYEVEQEEDPQDPGSPETPVVPTLPSTGSNVYLYVFGGMGKLLF